MLFKTVEELTCVFFGKEEIRSILVCSGELDRRDARGFFEKPG